MEDRDPAAVREGSILAGKYRVERVLGAGGMGVVVAARHVQLGQLVAIKFLKREALEQPGAVERFVRESRAVASLRNEHVSRVLDVGTLDSGAPYMVMEFLDGRDLGEVLRADGAMAIGFAVRLAIQACKALAEAHAAGIVHRDLKPQNLFLTYTLQGSPRLKLLDFGISKSNAWLTDGHGALTQTRTLLGSPLYMAPEQMRSSRKVDARSDVWAMGVVLFELLTTRWPFEAEDLPELCLKVVSDAPASLGELRARVPAGLVQVVERCLQKDPARRFQSAIALAIALEPFAAPPETAEFDADPTILSDPSFVEQRSLRATHRPPSEPTDLSMSQSLRPNARLPRALAAAPPGAGSHASPLTPATWGTPRAGANRGRRSKIALWVWATVLSGLVALLWGAQRWTQLSATTSSASAEPSVAITPEQVPTSSETRLPPSRSAAKLQASRDANPPVIAERNNALAANPLASPLPKLDATSRGAVAPRAAVRPGTASRQPRTPSPATAASHPQPVVKSNAPFELDIRNRR